MTFRPATLQKQRARNMRLYTTRPTGKRPRPTALKDYTRRLGRVDRYRSQPCPSKGPTATRQLTQCKPLIDMLKQCLLHGIHPKNPTVTRQLAQSKPLIDMPKQCLWYEIHPKSPTAMRQLAQHHLCAHGLLRIICFKRAICRPILLEKLKLIKRIKGGVILLSSNEQKPHQQSSFSSHKLSSRSQIV